MKNCGTKYVERKKVEEELQEAELRYRTVADFTHDWEYWETPDGKLIYVSPSCERITGYKAERFIENPDLISEITVAEDRSILIKHRHETLNVLEPRSIVFRITRKDGKIRWIEHVCQPVTDTQGKFLGVRAGNRDITIRKETEEALRKSEQLLLQAHKMDAIGRLAAGVAHEINNPLAIINEKAGLMKDFLELSEDSGGNKEKFLSLLNAIFESVTRCRTITHRLLGFSRRTDVSRDIINLNDALREVIGFLEKEVLFRNITLELHLREDLPNVTSDKGQLEQVVLNIMNNAVDAIEKGGRIEIITDVKDENTLTISIRDNGPGIPENVVKHIFEPFFTTKEKGKGTGLGLSISYGIMQKLGGTISVQSEVNKGTTFTIEIPLKSYGRLRRIILPQAKVLLIDDEVEFGSALAERLRLRDYDARAFSQAKDALDIIQSDPPHVVLLDFRMPGMDGIEVLKIIKQMNPSIEVIMLTGHGDTRSIEEGMKSGAFEYIMKPVDIGELILKINQAKNKRDSIK